MSDPKTYKGQIKIYKNTKIIVCCEGNYEGYKCYIKDDSPEYIPENFVEFTIIENKNYINDFPEFLSIIPIIENKNYVDFTLLLDKTNIGRTFRYHAINIKNINDGLQYPLKQKITGQFKIHKDKKIIICSVGEYEGLKCYITDDSSEYIPDKYAEFTIIENKNYIDFTLLLDKTNIGRTFRYHAINIHNIREYEPGNYYAYG